MVRYNVAGIETISQGEVAQTQRDAIHVKDITVAVGNQLCENWVKRRKLLCAPKVNVASLMLSHAFFIVQ